ncbi:unnamed protein product [Closterium sp. Naga37s-1]|nr:unnamed protein product [Closterium sp. Naga37s-1]
MPVVAVPVPCIPIFTSLGLLPRFSLPHFSDFSLPWSQSTNHSRMPLLPLPLLYPSLPPHLPLLLPFTLTPHSSPLPAHALRRSLPILLPALALAPPSRRDLSHNYLTGRALKPLAARTLYLSSNFLSGPLPDGACQPRSFDANCFTLPLGCALVPQRQEAACNPFCGVSSAAGATAAAACGGHGVCYPEGDSLAPTCLCDAGFVQFGGITCVAQGQNKNYSSSQAVLPPASILTRGGQRETKGNFTAEPVKLFVYEAHQGLSRCGLQLAFHANLTFSLSPRYGRVGFNGLAFVISATDQVGSGAGVGYGGMDTRSMAVEFDTLRNKEHGDMSSQHVGLNVRGEDKSLVAVRSPFPLSNRKAYTAWVDYEPGDPGTIQVFLADSQEKPQQAVLEWRLALCEVLQGAVDQPAFFFGFVASTTVKPFQRHVILESTVDTGLSASPRTVTRNPGACWAFALVASVEAAYGIALNAEAPQLSVESLFAAMGLTSEADKCSTGGSPTEALERLLMLPRGGVTEVGAPDPGCYTGRLDHVVLVIGYFILRNDGSQNRIAPPFWIIRNSWGVEWGDWGHMRMDIQGGDGVCGINVLPGIYPIVKMDVCGSDLKNPCYVGACINDGKGSYSCICPPNYVESTTIDSFPTCDPANVTASTLAVSGSNWWCPDVLSIVGLSLPQFTQQNKVTNGDGGVGRVDRQAGLVGIDCNQALPRDMVLQLGNPVLVPCTAFFYTLSGDTCWSISAQLLLSTSNLTALNPGLDCSEPIKAGRSLCVERNATFAFTVPRCLRCGVLTAQDTCERLLLEAGSEDDPTGAGKVNAVRWAELYRNNLGLICSSVIPVSASAIGSNTGVQVRGGGELGWGRKRWEGNGGKIGGWTKRTLDGCGGKESFLICQSGVFSNYLPLIAC